jgi:hypothetical protein
VVDDLLERIQRSARLARPGEGASEMVVHRIGVIADAVEQVVRLVEPAEMDQAARQAAQRPEILRLCLKAGPDARGRLREIGSGR